MRCDCEKFKKDLGATPHYKCARCGDCIKIGMEINGEKYCLKNGCGQAVHFEREQKLKETPV